MANIPMPDVTVEQIFEVTSPTLTAPTLPTVLVGQCRQIEYRVSAGEYDSNSGVVLSYPGLKTGAVVDTTSVSVLLSNSDGLFQLDSSSYTADEDSISIPSDVQLDVRVINNAQTGQTNGVFFTDASQNFTTKFRNLSSLTSSKIVISSPSDNQKTYDVAAIINKTTVLINDGDEVRASGNFVNGLSSVSTVVHETAVAVKEYVLGGAGSISFSADYLSTETIIDEEAVINGSSDIAVGDCIAFFQGGAETGTIHKIVRASNAGIQLASALGVALNSTTCAYKIFHPVITRTSSLAGDWVIASTTSGGTLYYGEISEINSIDTITMATALKNSANTIAPSAWTASHTFKVWRGAPLKSESNVYDGYLSVTDYTADVKVSYTADRNDLNDDITPITSNDEITSILGAAVPENPLAFAASIHSAVAPASMFYVIGASADTSAAHQTALEVLESKEVYSLVPLSQNLSVLSLYKPHVQQMSLPEEKMERSAIINRDIFISDSIIGNMVAGTDKATGTKLVVGMVNAFAANSTALSYTISMNGCGANAKVGDMVVAFAGSDATTPSYAEITSVSADFGLLALAPSLSFTVGNTIHIVSNTYHVDNPDVVDNTTAVADSVSIGDVVNLLDANGMVLTTVNVVNTVSLATGLSYPYQYLELESPDFGLGIKNKIFSATTAPLNKQEQAQYISDYAASIAERRVIHNYLPSMKLAYSPIANPTTQEYAVVPGYYMSTAIAAMKSSNPPHQPFTNLPIPLSTELYYTGTYFRPSQLDIIAGGGNYIIIQANRDSLPYARHQLTTDTTSIESREYSILTAIDWFAKYARANMRPYIGRYNITGNYMAQLKAVASAIIRDVVIIRKYLASVEIIDLVQDKLQPDTVYLDLDIGVLYPANKIRIRLYI